MTWLLTASLTLFPGSVFGQNFNTYSLEKEAALGYEMASELRKRTTVVDKQTIQDYVEHTGLRLAAHEKSPFSWNFLVVNGLTGGPTHEPLALPGGYIFVPTSLILNANSEDEFAAMLAHAMAHVSARDATRMASVSQTLNPRSIPLVFMGGLEDGRTLPRAYRAIERTVEVDADTRAVRILSEAGYNPEGLVQYIARMQPEEVGAMSTLPRRDARVASMKTAINGLQHQNSDGGFLNIQQELRGLTPSKTPRPEPSLLRPH